VEDPGEVVDNEAGAVEAEREGDLRGRQRLPWRRGSTGGGAARAAAVDPQAAAEDPQVAGLPRAARGGAPPLHGQVERRRWRQIKGHAGDELV
jgi:hypothetical protein